MINISGALSLVNFTDAEPESLLQQPHGTRDFMKAGRSRNDVNQSAEDDGSKGDDSGAAPEAGANAARDVVIKGVGYLPEPSSPLPRCRSRA